MAKQTYSVGQVLTSAQMTTLQANDYNQTVSAKVASYVLVAADAGTRVTMSNAGATTITVNTSLFAAGDTLFITNIGAGACTITAGTATVSTASSLVLAQYDSGRLYFTSTGVAIWEKYQGAAASGSMTLLSTTTLSGTSTVISSIDQTYNNLYILVTGVTNDVANGSFFWRPNNTANLGTYRYPNGDTTVAASFGGDIIFESGALLYASPGGNNAAAITIQNYASTSTRKPFSQTSTFAESGGADAVGSYALGGLKTNSAITSIGFHKAGGGSFTAGTVKIYGVK